jgi:hypothetical protein
VPFALDAGLARRYSKMNARRPVTETARMIRIKCPKCSIPLSLDDDLAGQATECERCGSRFRVPAPKAGAAAKPSAGKPRRADDDEEDEVEDYEDDDESAEEEVATERKKKRASKISDSTKLNIYLIGGMLLATVVLGVDSIFVRKLGIIVAGACGVGMVYCLLMLSVMAKQDNGPWMVFLWLPGVVGTLASFLVFGDASATTKVTLIYGSLLPLFVVAFGLLTWKRTQRLVISYVALYIMCGTCLGATAVNMGRIETRRAQVRALVSQVDIERALQPG